MISKAHSDIQSYIDGIPYGTVVLYISKVNKKIATVEAEGQETLRYTDSEAALHDIQAILRNLCDTGYSGKARLELDYKDGQVLLVTIHDKKKTQY